MLKRFKPFHFKVLFIICFVSVNVLALLPLEHIPGPKLWDKANHFIAFFVLTGLLYFCFKQVNKFFVVVLPLLGYGLLLEVLQGLTEYRDFSMFDLLADAVGIIAGIVVSQLVGKYLINIHDKQT